MASTPPASAAVFAVFGSPAAAWLAGADASPPPVLAAGAEAAGADGAVVAPPPLVQAANRMAAAPSSPAVRAVILRTERSSSSWIDIASLLLHGFPNPG